MLVFGYHDLENWSFKIISPTLDTDFYSALWSWAETRQLNCDFQGIMLGGKEFLCKIILVGDPMVEVKVQCLKCEKGLDFFGFWSPRPSKLDF